MLAAGQPLLSGAQDGHQIASDLDLDLDLDQILDLVVTIAKIPGTPEYRQSILETALAGLHRSGT
jgi:hypothetical protein